jgi:hypothetical protein
MPLETKDYVTFTFSAAALAVSLYNLVRARGDAKSLAQRTFEQKRFEAATTAHEIMARYAEIEGALETLRFEALRAANSSVVEETEKHIETARKRRSAYEVRARDLIRLPGFSGDLQELSEIEKRAGELKALEKDVSEYKALALNFVEDGRRVILAEAGTSSQSSSSSNAPGSA